MGLNMVFFERVAGSFRCRRSTRGWQRRGPRHGPKIEGRRGKRKKKRGGEKGEDEASRETNAAGQGVQGEINNLEKGGRRREMRVVKVAREEKRERAKK